MNSPFGNNRGLGRTPRRPDRLQGAALQGPAEITGDQRRWGIWAAATAAKTTPASTSIRACDRATTMLRRSSTQYARRPLLIRRVTTTPSGDQSNAMAPPSCAATVRCTNLLPKPSGTEGATTGGPPRSVHITTTSSSRAVHDTSRVPRALERAPYFAEFVANS